MNFRFQCFFLLILLLCLSACETTRHGSPLNQPINSNGKYHSGSLRPYTIRGINYKPAIPKPGFEQTGYASWYGDAFNKHLTSNGEVFDMNEVSAAHKTLPLPCIIEVTNLENGKKLRLRVNDRGPFVEGRILDLSKGAAKILGTYGKGIVKVKIKFLGSASSFSAFAKPQTFTPDVKVDDQKYRVQLGAFSDQDNAQKISNRLSDTHIEARDNLFIVYIGPFEDRQKAQLHLQKAIDMGFFAAIIKKHY